MRQSSQKVEIFAQPRFVGNRTPRYSLIVLFSHATLSSESKPTLAKVLSGFVFDYAAPALSRWRSFRLWLDRVRELSASVRGSVLGFQGVGESHYKMLARKRTREFSTRPFLLWHFSPGDKIENRSAQFLAVCWIVQSILGFIPPATVLA